MLFRSIGRGCRRLCARRRTAYGRFIAAAGGYRGCRANGFVRRRLRRAGWLIRFPHCIKNSSPLYLPLRDPARRETFTHPTAAQPSERPKTSIPLCSTNPRNRRCCFDLKHALPKNAPSPAIFSPSRSTRVIRFVNGEAAKQWLAKEQLAEEQ